MSDQRSAYAKAAPGFRAVSLLLTWGDRGLGWGIEAIFLANVVANGVVLALLLPDIFRLFRPALLRRGIGWGALWRYALSAGAGYSGGAARGAGRPAGSQPHAFAGARPLGVRPHPMQVIGTTLQLQAGRGDAAGGTDVPHGVDPIQQPGAGQACGCAALFRPG
jgi:hypothetical protein